MAENSNLGNPDSLVSLIGLGFGDCGKGLFTDYLCSRLRAHTVVRFNGGAQAGHNVVLVDGRHHTYSQFGSGTFQPGVETVLAHPVVVHPTALAIEGEHLVRKGVLDAFSRLHVDPRCRVTTPFHQAAGRLRELARGASAHGTCGVGVGETVCRGLARPDEIVHFGELSKEGLTLEKLDGLQRSIRCELDGTQGLSGAESEWRILLDPQVPKNWLRAVKELLNRLPPSMEDPMGERLQRPGSVIFEGAQGVLLDEWIGFHPHTTWSSPRPGTLDVLVRESGSTKRINHFGVLRSFLTRHGPGPFPTEDPALACLPEPHNADAGWQGRFRRGHPDALLLSYAIQTLGCPLDGLFLSHLDVFERGTPLQWCEGYEGSITRSDETLCTRNGDQEGHIVGLKPGAQYDLEHQEGLTELLWSVQPRYSQKTIASPAELIERVEATVGCEVQLTSYAPTREGIRAMGSLPL